MKCFCDPELSVGKYNYCSYYLLAAMKWMHNQHLWHFVLTFMSFIHDALGPMKELIIRQQVNSC